MCANALVLLSCVKPFLRERRRGGEGDGQKGALLWRQTGRVAGRRARVTAWFTRVLREDREGRHQLRWSADCLASLLVLARGREKQSRRRARARTHTKREREGETESLESALYAVARAGRRRRAVDRSEEEE